MRSGFVWIWAFSGSVRSGLNNRPVPKSDEAKLKDLLWRQQGQRKRLKGAKRIIREAQIALHKLKGKVAKTRQRIEAKALSPAEKAVRWAMAQQGTTEKPDGSNWGLPVSKWIRFTGYSGPVPWCGCFVARAVVGEGKADIPTRIRLGYNEFIVADARARRNGLQEVPIAKARPGDIVVFYFPHIALVRGKPGHGVLPTIEGNTSPTNSGSQANGGTVAAKSRPLGDVRLVARPDYP